MLPQGRVFGLLLIYIAEEYKILCQHYLCNCGTKAM